VFIVYINSAGRVPMAHFPEGTRVRIRERTAHGTKMQKKLEGKTHSDIKHITIYTCTGYFNTKATICGAPIYPGLCFI